MRWTSLVRGAIWGVACALGATMLMDCAASSGTSSVVPEGYSHDGGTPCDGADLSSDENNCGSCGNVCPTGQTCQSGCCTTPSPCDGADLTIDPYNCGACGNECGEGEMCQDGHCTPPCEGVDLSSDENNCGVCGNVCPAGTTCQNGQCVPPCNGADLSSDENDCGVCGHHCEPGDTCVNGHCIPACDLVPCPPPCVGATSSITSNFDGTAIAAGSTIWFTAVFKPTGLGTNTTFKLTNSHIQFMAGGTSYDVPVPDATVTFDASATSASTTFTGGKWVTVTPPGSGNTFLTAVAFPVTVPISGGVNPVTWTGDFSTNTPGAGLSWQWAAAVYSSFSSDYDQLDVQPTDDNHLSPYGNSNHAGTPEAFRSSVVGGARGGGGSNFTGSLSATKSITAKICP